MEDNEIGIAFLDMNGSRLGFSGGYQSIEDAQRHAELELWHRYPQAVRAVIYRGRTYESGQKVLEVDLS